MVSRSIKYLFFLVLIFTLISCGGEFSEFQQMSLNGIKNDGKLDTIEYRKIRDFILKSSDKAFNRIFKNESNEINDEKVKSYLSTYFTTQKIVFSPNDIYIPSNNNINKKFNVNVFIENSISMDGYVVGKTEFEDAIYNLLADFKLNPEYCDSLNLNFINKKVIPNSTNAKNKEISDFIEKLEPSTFRKSSEDGLSTNISDVFKTILDQTNDKSVSVLISDFVFSPGKNQDAEEYLNDQSSRIKLHFGTKLREIDLSSIVIQLESKFNGKYFDKLDKPHILSCTRPYYIWIIGKKENIESIHKIKILNNIKGSLNKYVFEKPNESKSPSFQILREKKLGDFSINNSGIKEISDITLNKDDKIKLGFSIAVDFSNSIQDNKYYTDKSIFTTSNSNYDLSCEIIQSSKKNDPSLSSYSHIINLNTSSVRNEMLKVRVLGKTPNWVVQSTSIDDTMIERNQDDEKSKTFGLQYLIGGIKNAYFPDSTSSFLNTLSISIKK